MKIIPSTRESWCKDSNVLFPLLKHHCQLSLGFWEADTALHSARGSWGRVTIVTSSGDCLSTKSSIREESWEDAWGGKGGCDLCLVCQSWRQEVHCVPLGDLLQPQVSEEGLGTTQETVCASHGPEDRTQGQWSGSLKRFQDGWPHSEGEGLHVQGKGTRPRGTKSKST